MVFVGTMYTQAGDLIGKALDAKGQAVIAEHNAQEQVNIAAVYAVIAAHEKNLTLVQDMQSILTLQVELMETLDKAKMMEYQHTVRNDVVKKLDYFAAKEDQFRASVQSILVAKATASVEESFKTDKTLQDNALAMVRFPPFELPSSTWAHLVCVGRPWQPSQTRRRYSRTRWPRSTPISSRRTTRWWRRKWRAWRGRSSMRSSSKRPTPKPS